MSEPAEVLLLIDGDRDSNKICVGFRGQFELLDETTEDALRIFRTDASPKVSSALLLSGRAHNLISLKTDDSAAIPIARG